MRLLSAETIILEARPSRRVTSVWLFTKALPIAFMTAVTTFIIWMIVNAPAQRGMPTAYPFSTGLLLVVGAFVAAWLCAHVYNVYLARTYVYYLTSQRFIIEGGILRRTAHAVEHRRVTDVQLSQNAIEQMFALGSVNLSTPGTANVGSNSKNRSMPELRLEGLTDGEAVFEAVSNCIGMARGTEL
jgi:uncharacterized membrane protein YdbT with pleckstrin-like domain